MSTPNGSRPRAGQVSIVCLGIAAVMAFASPGRAADPAVEFKVDIPAAPGEMQIYNLTPTIPPMQFINQKLTALKLPELKLENGLNVHVSRTPAAAAEQHQVHALVDPFTGEAHLLPNMAKLVRTAVPMNLHPMAAIHAVGKAALTDAQFIPKDATELRVADGIRVLGALVDEAPGAAKAEPKVMMTLVPAIRHVNNLRVYGQGSHALIAVANDQTVIGAVRRWHSATAGEKFKPTITVAQVRDDIERQLKPNVPAGAKAVVDLVTHAYYDAQGKSLQPVYRFEANLINAKDGKLIARMGGYVPIGRILEAVPDLAAKPNGPNPNVAPGGKMPAEVAAKGLEKIEVKGREKIEVKALTGSFGGLPTISVGEFVNQDWPTSAVYLDMANNFLSGLNSVAGPVKYARTIWWTAYGWQVNGPGSKTTMNAVNIAYTEPHGDWLLNTTKGNYGDLWQVGKIGTGGNPGFGSAAGGVMSTWVIMSCEVIPSYYDYQHNVGGDGNGQHCFDPWWGVFQGLHSVVGFRTVMYYPDNALNYGFGHLAAAGVDVHTAWFQEVAALHANESTYVDAHLNMPVHYDRASMIIDARNLGEPIYNVTPQSKSTQLWNFWMDN